MKKLILNCKEMNKRIPFTLVLIYLLGATFIFLNLKNYF